MKQIGCHATKLEEREYSNSDYKSYRKTVFEVKNEAGERITGEFKCAYGCSCEWLQFYDPNGYEWESKRYFLPDEWSIVNLSLGRNYGASVSCGYENQRSDHLDFRVDLFMGFVHLYTWEPYKAARRMPGHVELKNADVASYPGWVQLEWDEEDLFDCETVETDFAFRTKKGGELLHLPCLMPIGRMIMHPDSSGLFELINKSVNPGVRLAAVILLSDPELLRSLCDGADDPAVREKAAERLNLYEKLGYFPPDACELSQLLEEDDYGSIGLLICGEYTPTQVAIHALSNPHSYVREEAMKVAEDLELAEYIRLHDESK